MAMTSTAAASTPSGAALLVDEESAGREGLISNHPSGHAVAGTACEESVGGVGLKEGCREAGGLPVGVTVDESTDELFDVPATFLEFDCEPIEEAWVNRHFALDAEVFW